MVHWVYVLECEDDYLYVGETTRLFKRFNEHLRNRGGSNTIKHKPYKLIGLYNVNNNWSFIRYRNAIKLGEYNKFIIDVYVVIIKTNIWTNKQDFFITSNPLINNLCIA